MNFDSELSRKTQEIEEIIFKYIPESEGYQKIITDAMDYSLKAGGKRLRPILMNETYKLFGGIGGDIEPFLAAMEMIHTYSLVHDDLPAMDNDEFRRGKKTTWVEYGEAMGILAGDGLLNMAFEIMSRSLLTSKDIHRSAKALNEIAERGGIYGMIGGQVVDVESSGIGLTKDKLDFIYRLKTGALIEASMVTGAVIGSASDEEIDIIRNIAKDVGMAFQIQDDILDVTSTTEILGKPVLSDEKNQKTTYVTLMGIDEAKHEVERISKRAALNFEKLDGDKAFLQKLILRLINREK